MSSDVSIANVSFLITMKFNVNGVENNNACFVRSQEIAASGKMFIDARKFANHFSSVIKSHSIRVQL